VEYLKDIGYSISRFIKLDNENLEKRFISFVHICVEVDLYEGILDKIILMCGGKEYLQPLDYEKHCFHVKKLSTTRAPSAFLFFFKRGVRHPRDEDNSSWIARSKGCCWFQELCKSKEGQPSAT